MSILNKPVITDISNTAKTVFQTSAGDTINLSVENLTTNAILDGITNVNYTYRQEIYRLTDQLKISTVSGEFLEQKGLEGGLTLITADFAEGKVLMQLSGFPVIAKGTKFLINTNNYSVTAISDVINEESTIGSVYYDSLAKVTRFTLTTQGDIFPTLKFELKTDSTKTATIKEVTNKVTFTVDADVTTAFPAGSVIKYSIYIIPVISDNVGTANNVTAFVTATSASLPSSTGYVSFEGIRGGLDDETSEEFRNRLIEASSTLNKGIYNDAGYRRFLEDLELDYQFVILRAMNELVPAAGWSTGYFLKADNTLLDQSELNYMLDKYYQQEHGLAPPTETRANPRTKFLNATVTKQNVVIQGLVPDYNTLRTAIIQSLEDFFAKETKIGQIVYATEIQRAVERAVDNNNNTAENFVITTPSGSINPALNERIILGTVSFT